MKHRLVDRLRCPICQERLICGVSAQQRVKYTRDTQVEPCRYWCSRFNSLRKASVDYVRCLECIEIEVEEGILTCGLGHSFPIVAGIPRLLPKPLLDHVLGKYHRRYLQNNPDLSKRMIENDQVADSTIELKTKTLASFSYEWRTFDDLYEEYEDQFLSWIAPLPPSFFQGKLTLDAGCGMGRHVVLVAQYGSEVVGFDLSEAVEAAYRNSRHLPNVHIVQADIYSPPFPPEFDFVYSIGVLHHLPDTREAFQRLTRLIKPGGYMSIWVYGREENFLATNPLEMLRKITTKLPLKSLDILSLFLGEILHLTTKMYQFLDGSSFLKGFVQKLPSRDYFLQIADYDPRIKRSIVFDLLSTPLSKYFTKQELGEWFEDANFSDVKITWRNRNSWRGVGRKSS